MTTMRCLRGLVALTWASFLVMACGRPLELEGQGFISWGDSMVRQSVIAKSLEKELRVCLEGSMNSADLTRVRLWTKKAALTWLRVGKVIDNRVSGQVSFSCDKPHMTLKLRQGGGTSYASPSVATIYLTRPYGTWTHEFGHALAGLSDTYSGRTAGVCVSGQPQSLMCWGAYGPRANPDQWSSLWVDDVNGFQSNYRKLFGRELTPPTWAPGANLEAPLDVNQPWPGYQVATRDEDMTGILLDERLETSVIDYSEDTDSIDL